MKQTLALLLTIFTLSFAACTKNDNSVAPFFYLPNDFTSFKGDLNDADIKVYLPSIDGYDFTMIYRGIAFTASRSDHSFSGVYSFTATNGNQLTATGKLHLRIASGPLNDIHYISGYLEFDPGSVFASKKYSWTNK